MSFIQLATAHSLAPLARLHRAETTELFKALSIHRKASLTVNCDRALNHLYDLFGNDNLNNPLYEDRTGLTLHHASTLGLFNVVSAALVEATAVAQTHNAWFVRETEQGQEEFEEDDDFEEEDESTETIIDSLMAAVAEQLIPTELEAVVRELAIARLSACQGDHAKLVQAVDVIAHEQGPDVLLATIKAIMPKFEFDEPVADAPERADLPTVTTMIDALKTLTERQLRMLAQDLADADISDECVVADLIAMIAASDVEDVYESADELGLELPEIEEEDEEEDDGEEELGGSVHDEDEDDFDDEEEVEDDDDEADGDYADSIAAVAEQLLIGLEDHLLELCDELGIGRSHNLQSAAQRIAGTQSRRAILAALEELDLQPSLELIMALDEKAEQEHALGLHRSQPAEVGHDDDDDELDATESAFAENEAFADNFKLIACLSKLQSAIAQHLSTGEVSALLITVHH